MNEITILTYLGILIAGIAIGLYLATQIDTHINKNTKKWK